MLNFNEVLNGVNWLIKEKDGCVHFDIDTINGNTYAVVFGWADGFEPYENDSCSDDNWHICGKVAYQPNNSIMQCDYDCDWVMPYDIESGEVDDTELSITIESLENDIEWLTAQADRIINELR